jgi:D-3-phosphoglycerate dehydrogenase
VVLIRERTALTRAAAGKLPLLKLISQTGKVSGHVDVAAATARHRHRRRRGRSDRAGRTDLGAHHGRHAPRAAVLQRPARRRLAAGFADPACLIGTALGPHLGIWGYGKIGAGGRLRPRLRHAGGGVGPRGQPRAGIKDGYQAAASKEEFFAQADVLSLHLRLNDATRGIVKAADLALMKPTACFVNTSRAELVETDALEARAGAGRPGLAGWMSSSASRCRWTPLLKMDNVVAAPHLGYVEKDGYELYFRAPFQNIVDYAAGTPKNVLNPEALG